MDVSVILVSYNTKNLTRDCLSSIYEKTTDIEFDVFVVDNNSHDGSPEMIEQEFPQVHLIKNPDNKGFGAANNIAIFQSNAKYVFCLNTDTLLIDNSIKNFYDFMENNENIGACGGVLYNNDNSPLVCGGHFPTIKEILWKFGLNKVLKKQYRKIAMANNSDEADLIETLDYVTGADIFIRKSVLQEIGGFDEDFFMYYEETELCKRIHDAGYKIKLLPQVKIIHLESKSVKNSEWKNTQLYKSRFIYYKKSYNKFAYVLIKILYSAMFLLNPKYRKEEFRLTHFIAMWKS